MLLAGAREACAVGHPLAAAMAAELASLSFSLFFSVNRAPLVASVDKRAPIFDGDVRGRLLIGKHAGTTLLVSRHMRWHSEVLLSRELA